MQMLAGKSIYKRLLYALRQITWRRWRQAGRKGNSKKLCKLCVIIRNLCTYVTFLEPELAEDIPDVHLMYT